VGRTVYHSGTVGAAVTARNGGITGIAVSQKTDFQAMIGQGKPVEQRWETAAQVAGAVAAGVLANPPATPAAININVDNIDLADLKGWKRAEPISPGLGTGSNIEKVPTADPNRFELKWEWNRPRPDPVPGSDSYAVNEGYAAISWLTDLAEDHAAGTPEVSASLDRLLEHG